MVTFFIPPSLLCVCFSPLLWQHPLCREVFADFDPIAVAEFNEKKISAPGSTGSSLLSELKLWAIIENARQISKVESQLFYFLLPIWISYDLRIAEGDPYNWC